jgi:NitT/TauT family transport system substrate-binding protein
MRESARLLRGLLGGLAALSAVAVAAGPGPGAAVADVAATPLESPAVAGPAPQLTTVRFGSPQSISDAGVFIGRERGYFRQQGIEVDVLPFQSGNDIIVPLASGELQVGGGTFSIALLNAAERGVGLKLVADKGQSRPGFEFSQMLVRRGAYDSGEIRTLTDLRGRKIALSALRTGSESNAAQMLKQGGMSVDDVELVVMGYPDMLAAFSNGAIDGAVIIEPSLTAAVTRGLATTWEPGRSSAAYGGVYQAGVLLYSGQFAGQPDLARRFMTAYLEGIRVYNDAFLKGEGRADVVRVLTEATSVKDPALYDQMNMAGLDPDGRLVRESLQIELNYLRQRGYYTGTLTLDSILDLSFAEAAAQQLGPYR